VLTDFIVGPCAYCHQPVWASEPHGIRLIHHEDDLFARLLHEECVRPDYVKEYHAPSPPDATPPRSKIPRRDG